MSEKAFNACRSLANLVGSKDDIKRGNNVRVVIAFRAMASQNPETILSDVAIDLISPLWSCIKYAKSRGEEATYLTEYRQRANNQRSVGTNQGGRLVIVLYADRLGCQNQRDHLQGLAKTHIC